jgi:adenylate cyclase
MRLQAWSSRLTRLLVGILIVSLFAGERLLRAQQSESALGFSSAALFDQLDNFIYDNRLKVTKPDQSQQFDANVVIVDIDEDSLATIGRWPWPRKVTAQLIEKIGENEPAVIGTDIVFSEPHMDDALLSAAIHKYPVVLGYYFSNEAKSRSVGYLPSPSFSANQVQGAIRWEGFSANTDMFQKSRAGFFNPVIDADGKVRRLPLLAEHQGQVYDSFAVAVLRKYFSDGTLSLRDDSLVLGNGSNQSVSLPFSQSMTALIPFEARSGVSAYPSQGRFQYLSAASLLKSSPSAEERRQLQSALAGKIVLLGTSAIGIADLRATPVNQVLPGVESHATLLSGALAGQVKQTPASSQEMAAILLAVGGSLLAILFSLGGASGVIAIGFVSLIMLATAFSAAFASLGWWLPSASAYAMVSMLLATNLLLGYWGEGRARRAMQSLFGEYVPAHLVDQMSRDPKNFVGMLSENRELTMLFADVRGFTRIAETMEPAQLREFINEYLTAMTQVIHRNGGTVDKYIGDAIMAFWGAPLHDESHADRAVTAGREMLHEAKRLSVAFEARQLPGLSIGVGVNTGVVCVGDMGSKSRRAYTVLGDAVNLAARFESMTKELSVPLIIGETTAKKTTATSLVPLGSVPIKGRLEAVQIFTSEEFVGLAAAKMNELEPESAPLSRQPRAVLDEA